MAQWICVGKKPHAACQNKEQRRNNWKGAGCKSCDYTGLTDVGFWAS